MPKRMVEYIAQAARTGSSDFGMNTFDEIVGVVPVRDPNSRESGLRVVPGWKIHGDSPYTFFSGIYNEDEDGSVSGQAIPPESSKYFRRCCVRTAVHPNLLGTVVMVVYNSNGIDNETGRIVSIYQELWGSKKPIGGDDVIPYGGPFGGDFNNGDGGGSIY